MVVEAQNRGSRGQRGIAALLALDQRQRSGVPCRPETVGRRPHQGIGAALVHGGLQAVERGHAVRTKGTQFAVEIGGPGRQLAQRVDGEPVLFGPVQAGARQQLGFPVDQAGVHAVAVILDLMQPAWA